MLVLVRRVVLLGGISSVQNRCHRIDNVELYSLGAVDVAACPLMLTMYMVTCNIDDSAVTDRYP